MKVFRRWRSGLTTRWAIAALAILAPIAAALAAPPPTGAKRAPPSNAPAGATASSPGPVSGSSGSPESADAEQVSLRLRLVKAPDPAGPVQGHGAESAHATNPLTGPILILHRVTRSDGSAPMALRITPRTSRFSLAVPLLDLPKTAWVRLELRSAAGRVLASARHRQSEFAEHLLRVQSSAHRPIRPDVFTLRLNEIVTSNDASVTPESADYTFELHASDR